ncbi:MAG: TIGR00645 family protein [Rhodospirillales bacterium]|nr:TIGR00645 family protein [Rhodospirillales bacterium]
MIERVVEWLVFTSRWLLVPLYLGLAMLLPVFVIKFFEEFWHIAVSVLRAGEADFVLAALALIDLVLVANLLVMIVISGYETFVSKIDAVDDKNKPSWLGKLDAGTLKIKVAASIVAISSIHLLRAFMNINSYTNDKVMWLVIIHIAFVISALLLAYVDKIAFKEKGR